MKNKYIQYQTLLKRGSDLNRMKEQGLKFLYRRNRFKLFCGVACLVVAVIPNGLGLIFYPVGFMLLGIGFKDLAIFKENLKFKLWLRLNK